MIQITLLLFTIYGLSIARRLLQFRQGVPPQIVPNSPSNPVLPSIPIRSSIPTLGSYQQQCAQPQSDFVCRTTGLMITDYGTKKITCNTDYSCCMCHSLTCGTTTVPCDEIAIGGSYGAYGVGAISIYGSPQKLAILSCGAEFSCVDTIVDAINIDSIGCGADNSCSGSIMNLINSKGIICGQRACEGAKFVMMNNNGGQINCIASEACIDAEISTQNIQNVRCNGPLSCSNANIKISNPLRGFALVCNGDLSCENLKLVITISGPLDGVNCPSLPTGHALNYIDWKGITCGSPEACKGLEFTVINNGCNGIIIEDFECEPNAACIGSIFNFDAGIGIYANMVNLQNCKCGPSCKYATGIDKCYNNLHIMSCPDIASCSQQKGYISNPANGFKLLCPKEISCYGLELDIIISGHSQNIIRRIDGYQCYGPMGCQNAIIKINNQQIDINGIPIDITIETISCLEMESCKDATFITGPNVNIKEIICNTNAINACNGCIVKKLSTDSSGEPCFSYTQKPQVQEGNIPVIPTIPAIPSIPSIPIVPTIPQPDPSQGPQTPFIIPVQPATTTTTTSTSQPIIAKPIPAILGMPIEPILPPTKRAKPAIPVTPSPINPFDIPM